MHPTLLSRVALVFLALSTTLLAQEWPRFRGPNGSGIAKTQFPDTLGEKDIVWKIDLPGTGHASPVISGGRVFTMCNAPGSAKRQVVCVNAADGKIVWQKEYETGTFREHSDNSFASSSPAVDAERVYMCWMSPEGSGLVALDQKDGKELWKKSLGAYVSQHGPGVSPIVENGLVVLDFDQDQPKSFVAAFDAKTGDEKWRWEKTGTKHSSSTPCIFTPEGGKPQVVTISFDTGMTGLDLATGKVAWQLPGMVTKRCVASPVVAGALVVGQCGEGQAESFVYVIKPGMSSAEKKYEVVRVGGYVPTPIVSGDFLFLWKENGLVTCIRTATNEQVWSERVQGPFYGSPIISGNRLYNVTRKGDLVVLNAGDKFQEVSRCSLGEGSHATPAVAGGRMFIRTFTHLMALGK